MNGAFAELFAADVPPLTPPVAGSNGPPSTDLNLGDGARLPGGPECLRSNIVEGFSLVIYEGGVVDDLLACARSLDVTALYALHDGQWVSYILGAPEFVNRHFRELFAEGLLPLTPLVARSEGTPEAN